MALITGLVLPMRYKIVQDRTACTIMYQIPLCPA
jgi:hypothetical protein